MTDTLIRIAQRIVVRTELTPLRALWARLYDALTFFVAVVLTRAHPGTSVYLRGSAAFDDPVFGLSDLDMIAVTAAGDTRGPERLRRTWKRLCSLPIVPNLVYLHTYDEAELQAAVSGSCMTFSLEGVDARAAFLGRNPIADEMNLLDRPGPFGPSDGWRLVRGPERLRHAVTVDHQENRIAAWLELQMWCRHLYAACAGPTRPYTAYLCVKLVVEPLRLLLWLVHEQRILRRSDVLAEARHRFPEYEDAIRAAQVLRAQLPRDSEPPLEDVLPVFLRLCAHVASLLTRDAEEAGSSAVELLGDAAEELVLAPDTQHSIGAFVQPGKIIRPLPLVDWRALAIPGLPDETFASIDGDVSSPSFLGAAALAGNAGTYPLLEVENLLLLPSTAVAKFTGATDRQIRWAAWGRGKLRAIQCAATDPVTYALAHAAKTASFPELRGWSARDVARRAVAEHRAWLELEPGRTPPPVRGWIEPQEPSTAPTIRSLARVLTAARAALFLGSIERGMPQLTITLAAVTKQLAIERPEARDLVEEALRTYRACRLHGTSPDARLVGMLRDVVVRLPPYA